MARGLAREQSRAKGLEKRQGGKGKDDGLTPAQRTERCAEPCPLASDGAPVCIETPIDVMLCPACRAAPSFCMPRLHATYPPTAATRCAPQSEVGYCSCSRTPVGMRRP